MGHVMGFEEYTTRTTHWIFEHGIAITTITVSNSSTTSFVSSPSSSTLFIHSFCISLLLISLHIVVPGPQANPHHHVGWCFETSFQFSPHDPV
jgi:hypothetical protein